LLNLFADWPPLHVASSTDAIFLSSKMSSDLISCFRQPTAWGEGGDVLSHSCILLVLYLNLKKKLEKAEFEIAALSQDFVEKSKLENAAAIYP
jgi:hypothetical protein